MRYAPNTDTGTAYSLDAGNRPPLDLLPPKLAGLLRERDRIAVQRSEAASRVVELSAARLDAEAEAQDADAAMTAARAGKAIPKTSAVEKLANARDEAARNLAAQEAAFAAVTNEAHTLRGDSYPWEDQEQRRADARAQLEAAAHAFADVVDATVAADAAVEWLRTEVYQPKPIALDVDVIDLKRHNITRTHGARPVAIRDVIVRAATTVLEGN